MTQALEDAPKITLGGLQWAVPMLVARQNRIIDPLILSLLPIFAKWQVDMMLTLSSISAPQYEALQEIAYQGIKQASPDTTRERFLDLPVTLPELIAAFSVIAQQTGVFARTPPGEAPAGIAPLNSQTGTES